MFFQQSGFPGKPLTRLFLLSASVASLAVPARADQFADAFFASPYNYCDAVIVGALWGVGGIEGKTKIGATIIQRGGDGAVESLLTQSRGAGNKCNFEDTGFQYKDAVRLASIWGVGIADAKSKAAQIVSQGRYADVAGALGNGAR